MGDKVTKGKIIILNGVSSAGKTTLSKALQSSLDEHYFWVANDTFCDMCAGKFWDSDCMKTIYDALLAMIHCSKTMSDLGYNIIIDQVFLNDNTQGDLLEICVRTLINNPVFFVRVDCSDLQELRKREKERGDRNIGQAESQLPLIHQHGVYDMEIDTAGEKAETNAVFIKSMVTGSKSGTAIQNLMCRLKTSGSVYK